MTRQTPQKSYEKSISGRPPTVTELSGRAPTVRKREFPERTATVRERKPHGRQPFNHSLTVAARNARRASAFSLIELLVVITIIILILGATIPILSGMQRYGRDGAAVNTVDVAVKVVRAYATQGIGNLKDVNTNFPGAVYSGAAIIFTPNGQIRVVQNSIPAQAAVDATHTPLEPTRIGYEDVPNLDYIRLPSTAGVVGISWDPSGKPLLLAPPFAVRFNAYGQLIAGKDINPATNTNNPPNPPTCSRLLYYDGNFDGVYQNSGTGNGGWNRTSSNPTYNLVQPYDPSFWDSRATPVVNPDPSNPASIFNPSLQPQAGTGKVPLPFEEIETVIGVLVFNQTDFHSAGFNLQNLAGTQILNAAAYNHLLTIDPANPNQLLYAKPLYFSRYSGTLMRDPKP